MRDNVVLHLQQKCPNLATVTLAQSFNSKGIQYRTAMIIVHGSVGGLQKFIEILQMSILQNTLIFICKEIASWYREHYRAFEIQSSSATEIVLAELSELIDDYPLIDYNCGSRQMVTLKRYIHVSGNYS